MKRFVILAIILAAGISAYPQATRSARTTNSEKGSEKKETVSRSASKSQVNTSSERKAAVKASDQSVKTRSAASESAQRQVNRSATTSSQNREVNRSAGTSTQQRETNRSSSGQSVRNPVSRSTERQVTAPPARQVDPARVERGSAVQSRSQSGTSSTQRAVRPDDKAGSVSAGTQATRSRSDIESTDVRIKGSGATRAYREAPGALTTADGRIVKHQNDEVFAKRKYRVDYDNYEALRRSNEFRIIHRDYYNWYNHRTIRVVHYHPRYVPVPIEVRRVRYVYRPPVHVHLVWTPTLFHRFMYYYPMQPYWDIEFGREIQTISAYDAMDYVGTVRRVYGKVEEVYYSREDQNYVLYIGERFPYHDLSVVIPSNVMWEITRNPYRYFENRMIWSVGLINIWEGKPEMIIRDEEQIRRY